MKGIAAPNPPASHEPLAFSRCMRGHGVTDFLDADAGTQARDREQRCESPPSLTCRPPWPEAEGTEMDRE
jgi:hypothetical protein